MIDNGIYSVSFQGGPANTQFGLGLAVVEDGRIHGGDFAYLYRGTFEDKGGQVGARISVEHYQGPVNSVLGALASFELQLIGSYSNGTFHLSGSIPQSQQLKITITGHKRADLLQSVLA